MTKSRGILRLKLVWTVQMIEEVRRRYPHEKTEKIALDIGAKLHQVYRKASRLGLKKTQAYLDSPDACRLRRGDKVGVSYRFPKGHVPANKGVKGINYEGCIATQFKKGQKPHSWLPIGSERFSKEGYLQRKITETGYPPRDWRGVHILLWEEHRGPIPKNHIVAFKDGNKNNIVIENLECISKAENMRRNSINNLPESLREVIQLKGAITRRITCHERNQRHHDAEKSSV